MAIKFPDYQKTYSERFQTDSNGFRQLATAASGIGRLCHSLVTATGSDAYGNDYHDRATGTKGSLMDSRFVEWLQRAKERAAQMEQFTPVRAGRNRKMFSNLLPAAPDWFEGNRIPIQDPPNIVFLPRRALAVGHYNSKSYVNRPTKQPKAA
ncbi:MAG: hypothetical protein H0X30_22695 [Anaerolineae bacterium]|nr:hypothetical protein [Anaerolineae bacterium]